MARKLERSRYRMLYLIGVDHSVQHDGRAGYEGSTFERLRNEFPTFLDGVARRIGATVIAEELNEDALNKWGATKSVADTVASQMNIKHVFCDPSISEREQLGMKGTNNPDDFSRREDFWLDKLATLKGERILFILGADHVESFLERARKAGFSVDVAEKYYGKEYFSPLNIASSRPPMSLALLRCRLKQNIVRHLAILFEPGFERPVFADDGNPPAPLEGGGGGREAVGKTCGEVVKCDPRNPAYLKNHSSPRIAAISPVMELPPPGSPHKATPALSPHLQTPAAGGCPAPGP